MRSSLELILVFFLWYGSCLLSSVFFLHLDRWQLSQGSDLPKPFLKSIIIHSNAVPSFSMELTIINSAYFPGNLLLFSVVIIVFYHYFNDWLLTCVLLLLSRIVFYSFSWIYIAACFSKLTCPTFWLPSNLTRCQICILQCIFFWNGCLLVVMSCSCIKVLKSSMNYISVTRTTCQSLKFSTLLMVSVMTKIYLIRKCICFHVCRVDFVL